jgi:signal transduction histidine kinase
MWYGIGFFFASVMVFVLLGLFLAKTLQVKDRELLQSRFQAYAEILSLEGVKGLHSSNARKKIADTRQYYVRYGDNAGNTIFLHIPDDHEHDSEGQSVEGFEKFLDQHESSTWIVFPGLHYGDDIELVSGKIGEGYLQVGKDTEDREEFLKEYLRSFLTVFFPMLILAIAFGFLLSTKLLAPIRWLTSTVIGIRDGRKSARVPIRANGDDLDELGALFNQLMDRNEILMKAMTESLDNVAHDLRTPMMRLRNSIQEALEKKLGEVAMREAMSDALENSDVILKILNATMDISEAVAGTLHLSLQKTDVKKVLDSIIDLYNYFANEKGFKVEAELEDQIFASTDQTRLIQAVGNLLDNAIKYAPKGSTIRITSQRKDEWVVISVLDEGPGVDPEEVDKIWERFYRGDKSRSSRGLGLGLSLVKAIVTAHGGSVEYEALSVGGSAFHLRFPKWQ